MSHGFGLLEILAALTLLSISTLALINGLLNAQHHSIQSLWLLHSTMQTENIYESMLSNPIALHEGNYFQTPSASPSCIVCMPAEQAEKELFMWQSQLNNNIPEQESTIVPIEMGQQIIIKWPENKWITYGGI